MEESNGLVDYEKPPGTPPGELVADPGAGKARLRIVSYGPDGVVEEDDVTLDRVRELRGRDAVLWIDVIGVGDVDTLRGLADEFSIHRLALEDVQNPMHRPKMEDYDGQLMFVLRMISTVRPLTTEQISVFLGSDYVLTFQEHSGDPFEPVRSRIRKGRRLIRRSGPDYLCYALIDAVIDGYFPAVEDYADRLESLEEQISQNPRGETLEETHEVKRELRRLRRAVSPQREFLNAITRHPNDLVTDDTRVYFRDCDDHAVRILDLVESYREWSSDLIEFFISNINNRTNEVMRTLTLIATIFIPLTFIAGIYGMNFNPAASPWNMPELDWVYGYPGALLLMLVVGVASLVYFKRKGWLGGGASEDADERNSE